MYKCTQALFKLFFKHQYKIFYIYISICFHLYLFHFFCFASFAWLLFLQMIWWEPLICVLIWALQDKIGSFSWVWISKGLRGIRFVLGQQRANAQPQKSAIVNCILTVIERFLPVYLYKCYEEPCYPALTFSLFVTAEGCTVHGGAEGPANMVSMGGTCKLHANKKVNFPKGH